MMEKIADFFLETVGREWCVFLCSLLPVIELRGAIPLGAGLGMDPVTCFLLAVAGNLLPVPFLLWFIRAVLRWMQKIPFLSRFAAWLERRAESSREKIERIAVFGLAIFVAIPLPGTGAWTGSLAAALMGMKFQKALLSIAAGVLAAGLIMLALSYGTVAVIHGLTVVL